MFKSNITWAYSGLTENNTAAYSLSDLVKMFLADRSLAGVSLATIESYQVKLSAFCMFTGCAPTPAQTNRLQVSAFINYLREQQKFKSTTVANYYRALSTFFSWVDKNGYCNDNPMRGIPRPKTPKTLPRFLTENQVAALIENEALRENWWGIRSTAIIGLLLATGLRRAELCNLTLDDISIKDLKLNVRAGKGNKDRIIPLDPEVIPLLEDWLIARESKLNGRPAPWLFISRNGGRLSEKEVWEHINNAGKRIGVNLSPHMIRHTFATLYLTNSGNIEVLREILGHTDIETTGIYLHTSGKMMRADLLKASPLKAIRRAACKANYKSDIGPNGF